MDDQSKFVAVAVIYDPANHACLLQHRDSHARINPNMWGLFGGSGEAGETPMQAIIRELHEEISITFPETDLKPLHDYAMHDNGLHRYVFFITNFPHAQKIQLHEGQAYRWVPVDELSVYEMSARSKKDLDAFLHTLS